MFFKYGNTEIEYLKSKDEKMKNYIEKTGIIERQINPDLFSALVDNILSQQISSKAAETVTRRFFELEKTKPKDVLNLQANEIAACGTSNKKADYILGAAEFFIQNKITNAKIKKMEDEEIIELLTKIKGVGAWTVEMLLIFSLCRKNILSYNDLAIRNGIKIMYKLDDLNKADFNLIKEKFSPYCTIASFYFWNISNKAV